MENITAVNTKSSSSTASDVERNDFPVPPLPVMRTLPSKVTSTPFFFAYSWMKSASCSLILHSVRMFSATSSVSSGRPRVCSAPLSRSSPGASPSSP